MRAMVFLISSLSVLYTSISTEKRNCKIPMQLLTVNENNKSIVFRVLFYYAANNMHHNIVIIIQTCFARCHLNTDLIARKRDVRIYI